MTHIRTTKTSPNHEIIQTTQLRTCKVAHHDICGDHGSHGQRLLTRSHHKRRQRDCDAVVHLSSGGKAQGCWSQSTQVLGALGQSSAC